MKTSQVYQFGPFQLLPGDRLLLRGEKVVKLAPKVFDTLVFLVQNNGHVVEKDELIRCVWPEAFVEESSLTRTISVLRKALNTDEASSYIETVPKVGYRFVANVKELGLADAEILIEKLIVSRTSTIEESRVALNTDFFLRSGVSRVTRRLVQICLAVAGITVLICVWLLLPRSGTTDARANPILGSVFQLSDVSGQETYPSLSPDGGTIVYASNRSGNWDVYLQQTGSKTSINLTADNPTEDTHPAFSPDGRSIAFRSGRNGGGIFLMSPAGGDVRRVSDFGFNPAWSPDGNEIVCAMDGIEEPTNRSLIPSRLWAINVNSGEKRLVSEVDSVHPQWSPNGHRIAYWGLQKGGQRDIWTVSADGKTHQAVTNDGHFNWNPVWSSDGKFLYFISNRSGSMNLWRVSIDEQSGRVLSDPEAVTTPSSYTQHVTFSRDGKRLAYVRVANRHNIKRALFDPSREKLNGEPTWVTEGDKHTSSPDLSADGEWISFDSQGARQEDIFIARNDGSAMRQVTNDPYRDRNPRWSPDGKRLAFYSDRGGKYEIWTVNSDGSQLKQLTNTTSAIVFYPVWSPDGSKLAYRTRGNPASIISVENPSEPLETLPPLPANSDWKFTPWSWSSDGEVLAGWVTTKDQPHAGIAIFSIKTKRFETLSEFGNRPLWLSDNQRLIFFHQNKLYLLDRASRKIKELLSISPDQIEGISIAKDDRVIYFSTAAIETDIWLATFE